MHFTIKGATFEIRFSHKDSNSLFHAKKVHAILFKILKTVKVEFNLNSYFPSTVKCIEKDENKEKETRNGPFGKV